jgi:hypothetical protein
MDFSELIDFEYKRLCEEQYEMGDWVPRIVHVKLIHFSSSLLFFHYE